MKWYEIKNKNYYFLLKHTHFATSTLQNQQIIHFIAFLFKIICVCQKKVVPLHRQRKKQV